MEGCRTIWLRLGTVHQELAQLQPEAGILAARQYDIWQDLRAHIDDQQSAKDMLFLSTP